MQAFVGEHYGAFKRLAEPDLAWAGAVPVAWANALDGGDSVGGLPSSCLSRRQLRVFCQDSKTSDEAAFIACMAWGGMNRRHGRSAWAQRTRWLPLVRRLRSGALGREDAYAAFHRAAIDGLGPAYFTKLIYYLRRTPDGYIMDQWTGKSVSLIVAPRFIEITTAGWVTHGNDAAVYRAYCAVVERVRDDLREDWPDIEGEVIEEMMFSRGGRRKHPWRSYVIAHWSKA